MRLASRGQRDIGQGIETVADAGERARLRWRALGITTRAALVAAAVTAALLLFP